MDFLYISPEFPPNYAHFIEQLHSQGVRVWGLGEADFYFMPESLRSALVWYVRTDLNNAKAVQQALDELLRQKKSCGQAGSFDLVESHNEQWLSLEGIIYEVIYAFHKIFSVVAAILFIIAIRRLKK